MKMEGSVRVSLKNGEDCLIYRLRYFKIAPSFCLTRRERAHSKVAFADLHTKFSQLHLWFVRTGCQCNAARVVSMATSRRRRIGP